MTAHDAVEAGARALAGWYHGTDARWCAYQREARCAITAAEPILTGPLRQRIAECEAVIAEEHFQVAVGACDVGYCGCDAFEVKS